MKSSILKLIILSFILLNSSAFAGFNHHGYEIKLDSIDSAVASVGDRRTYKGTICKRSISFFSTFLKKRRCSKINSKNVLIKGFYPDYLNSVDNDIVLSVDKKTNVIHFQYTTPEVSRDIEYFTLEVVEEDKRLAFWQRVLDKLVLRRDKLVMKLEKYTQIKLRIKKLIQRKIDYLNRVITKVESFIDRNPKRLASYRQPLYISRGSDLHAASTTTFGQYRMSVETQRGILLEGESTELSFKLMNLEKKNNYWRPSVWYKLSHIKNRYNKNLYVKVWNNNRFLKEYDNVDISDNKDFFKDLVFNAQENTEYNDIKVALYRKQRFWGNRLLGEVNLKIPTIKDEVSPVWSSSDLAGVLSQKYFKVLSDKLDISASDTLGSIDISTLDIKLNEVTFTNYETLKSSDEEKYTFSLDFSSLEENIYNLTFSLQDSAGNYTSPNDLSFQFIIDKTSPEIQSEYSGEIMADSNLFLFNATVVDISPVDTQILFNGNELVKLDNKDITLNLNLVPGKNSLKIISTDKANNESIKEFVINNDGIPPTILAKSPVESKLFLDTFIPQIEVTYQDLESGVDISRIEIFRNGESNVDNFLVESGLLRSKYTQALPMGFHKYDINIYDKAGNKTSLGYDFYIGFQNVEIISTIKNGSILQDKNPPVAIEVKGSLKSENSVIITLNDQVITNQFNRSNNSYSIAKLTSAVVGENKLKISAVDAKDAIITNDISFSINIVNNESDEIAKPDEVADTLEKEETIAIDNPTPIVVSNSESNISGAGVYFSDDLNKETTISVKEVNLSIIPDALQADIGASGPVVDLSTSVKQTSTDDFADEVIVSIPFDKKAYENKNLQDELRIVRYSRSSQTQEVLTPFFIDNEKGLAYVKTKNFSIWYSRFYVDSREIFPSLNSYTCQSFRDYGSNGLYGVDVVSRVVDTDCIGKNVKICSFKDDSDSSATLELYIRSGVIGTSNFSYSIDCPNCPATLVKEEQVDYCGQKQIKLTFTKPLNRPLEEFKIPVTVTSGPSPSDYSWGSNKTMYSPSFIFQNINTGRDEVIAQRDCSTPGTVCKVLGTDTAGFTSDNTTSGSASQININTNGYQLTAMSTDSAGRLIWIEPRGPINLPSSNTEEFLIRRLNTQGKIETISSFNLSLNEFADTGLVGRVFDFQISSSNESIYLVVEGEGYINFPLNGDQVEAIGDNPTLDDRSPSLYKVSLQDGMAKRVRTDFYSISSMSVDTTGDVYVKGVEYEIVRNFSSICSRETDEDILKYPAIRRRCSLIEYYLSGIFKLKSETDSGSEFNSSWERITRKYSATNGLSSPAFTDYSGNEADGEFASNFSGYRIQNIKALNGEIYFTLPEERCIRKFDKDLKLKSVAGICEKNSAIIESTPGLLANESRLGRVSKIFFDGLNNMYYLEQLPKRQIFAIKKDGLISRVIGYGNTPLIHSTLPSLASELELVTISNAESVYDAVTVDIQGNVYGAGDTFIYRVENPLNNPVVNTNLATSEISNGDVLLTNETLVSVNLSGNNNISETLYSFQDEDGFFDLEQVYLNDKFYAYDVSRRLFQTADILEYLYNNGNENNPKTLNALNWLANQKYTSTSLVARQLEILALFGKGSNNKDQLLQRIYKILLSYKDVLYGWGSNATSIPNNYDTASAITALSKVSKLDFTRTMEGVEMSIHIFTLNELASKQFLSGFSQEVFGGFGFMGIEINPDLNTTLKVAESMIHFSQIPYDSTSVIASRDKDRYLRLRDNELKFAINNVITYLNNYKNRHGSFGSLNQKITAVKLLDLAKNSGILSPENQLIVDSLLLNSINNINSDQLNTLDLASVSSIKDSLNQINVGVLLNTENYGQPIDREPASTTLTSPYGNGKDGDVFIEGSFNINNNASGKRLFPDGIVYEKTNYFKSI